MVNAAGLVIPPQVFKSMIPQLKFEPSIAVAAGRIDRMQGAIDSFREPLKRAVKEIIAPSIRKNFDVGGRPSWEPLTEFTIQRRAEDGYGAGPILERTGRLRHQASQPSIWRYTDTSAAILDLPSSIWYGKLHQSGFTDSLRGTEVPARPFIMLQDEDIRGVEKLFAEWIEERFAAVWGEYSPRGG